MPQKTYSNHNMKIRWTRGTDEIKYTRPDLYFCLGTRGCLPIDEQIITPSGKQTISEFAKQNGGLVLSDNQGVFEYNFALPFFKGLQRLKLVVTDKGIFRATNEHPFFTDNGWKKVSELAIGQSLYILQDIPKSMDVSGLDYLSRNAATNIQLSKDILQKSPRGSIRKERLDSYRCSKRASETDNQTMESTTSRTPQESQSYADLRLLQKGVPSLPLCSRKEEKEATSVLFTQMPEHLHQQVCNSTKQSVTRKTQPTIEKAMAGSTPREKDRSIKAASDKHPEQQRYSSAMGKDSPRGTCSQCKALLSGEPPSFTKQFTSQRQNDEIRDCCGGGAQNAWVSASMEQSCSLGRCLEVSRFSDTEQQYTDRMQWQLLAQPNGNGREEKTISESWVFTDSVIRGFNQARHKINYSRATILSIFEDAIEPVYDLAVNKVHNFYLANGLLTHNSGKSTFLENTAEGFLEAGNGVLDLFGSKDGESLAWLRSKWAKDKKILLLKGENVDVKCSWPVKNAEQLEMSDFENYDLIISSSPLYANMDQEFSEASIIENKLYQRMEYDKIVFMCCREASNFFYSRLKVSDNQLFAKSEMVYLLRESRHMGVSLGLDSLRSYAIDIDIRCLADYTILKAQGVQGLSRELKWLYNYIDAKLLRTLSPEKFFVITRTGSIGAGVFKEITWHKQERENILQTLGITREVGEMTREAQNKGTFKTVSDKEHKQIIERYGEGDISMVNLALEMQRSSRTIQMHVEAHNEAVEKAGFCGVCKRAKGKYENSTVGHGLSS